MKMISMLMGQKPRTFVVDGMRCKVLADGQKCHRSLLSMANRRSSPFHLPAEDLGFGELVGVDVRDVAEPFDGLSRLALGDGVLDAPDAWVNLARKCSSQDLVEDDIFVLRLVPGDGLEMLVAKLYG